MRCWLRKHLREGFWFPIIQSMLRAMYLRCPGTRFNNWLKDPNEEKGPAGASELIVLVSALIGVIWLSLVQMPFEPLSGPIIRYLTAVMCLGRLTEIGVVAAYTFFVYEGRIYSTRRSLACALVNLVEMGLYSSLILILCNWAPASAGSWALFKTVFSDIITLQRVAVSGGTTASVYVVYLQILSILLMSATVANLIGRITHDEVPRKTVGDSPPS